MSVYFWLVQHLNTTKNSKKLVLKILLLVVLPWEQETA